jgi:GT2 family glycosyltransferase
LSSAPRTAIVIVTYNGRGYLRDLFDTLRAHTDLRKTALIVVDNASTDGTLETLRVLETEGPAFHLLPQATNTGFTGGNNIGMRLARSLGATYALLLNQDTVVTPGWLDRLETVMDARPDIASAQPLLLLFDEPERVNTAGNQLHFCGFGYVGDYRKLKQEVAPAAEVRNVPFATGAALMLRLSAADEVGDFDDRFFLYHEDSDLQVRLRQRGYEVVVVTDSVVLHKYTSSFSNRKFGQLERNRWLLLLKDWPWQRLVAAAPALAAVELGLLAIAARGGWLPEKLAGYRYILGHLPEILVDRKIVRALRSPAATDASILTGSMDFEGLAPPAVMKVVNAALSAYWRLAMSISPR